jgi:hypothetical protein
VLAILVGTLINNTRIGDVKEVLRAGLKAQRAETETRMSGFDAPFDRLEGKIDRIAETMSAIAQRSRAQASRN